jgi:hypothetical protein
MGFDQTVGRLTTSGAGDDGGMREVEKRANVTAEQFLVAVTTKLCGKTPCFRAESQESRDDILML